MEYIAERFADIQLLRYSLHGFEKLSLRQKMYIFYLSEAAIYGRDIVFEQFGEYNLHIRKILELAYENYTGDKDDPSFSGLSTYLKQVWFSSGIHHHYSCEKFAPQFSEEFLREVLAKVDDSLLPLKGFENREKLYEKVMPLIFNPHLKPKRVCQDDGMDLVTASACNYYQNVTQSEVEQFYQQQRENSADPRLSFGLNTTLVKENGVITERIWRADGMFGKAIKRIVECLKKAKEYTENEQQNVVLELLVSYYESGDLSVFDKYSIEWLKEQSGTVDFINGFIEVYGDPLGIKGSWEGIVEYLDAEATRRCQVISGNAQWFEDHSPVDQQFRKEQVKGVSAKVICAAMLGGDNYPASAIGINLPNADWIRTEYGSKSITISNLIEAYDVAAKGSGLVEEFASPNGEIVSLIKRFGCLTGSLHTDLHECVGHGSGKTLPEVEPTALKAHGNTIEEARADLFALYFLADEKMVELGLVPDREAYKAEYYTYLMNGLMTQLARIKTGGQIEEAHMRNRALIARWVIRHGKGIAELVKKDGKSCVEIYDYPALRMLFGKLLSEVQRIKSTGDFEAARELVEDYGVRVDAELHAEVLRRYEKLGIAPYKGFINPRFLLMEDEKGNVTDVSVDYTEGYVEQMLRYGRDYATLI